MSATSDMIDSHINELLEQFPATTEQLRKADLLTTMRALMALMYAKGNNDSIARQRAAEIALPSLLQRQAE
jgi:hypothetical protein